MVTAAIVSDTLSAIGAIGGLLSIVGVGLLILLVASQSRQIRAMREWIEQEPQRQQETAQRVIAEVQRRIAAARERRATPGAPVVPPLPAVPGAAAGVKPAPGTLGATPEAQAVAAKAGDGPATEIQSPGAPSFAPLTPAGGGDGSSVPPPTPVDDDEPAIVSELMNQETQAADVLGDDDFLASVPAARSRDQRFGEDEFDPADEEPRSNRLLFGVGAVALLAGIVLILSQLLGGGDTPKSTDTTADGGGESAEVTPTPKATPSRVDPSTVTVRVYNGTQINGLACRATNALKAKDYSVGDPLTRGSNDVLNATVVMYRPNFKTAASQIAKDLGIASSSAQPIDQATSADAGETAEVVVITGADYDDGSSGCSTTG